VTRMTNARLAGFTYLFYIAVAFPALTLSSRALAGDGVAAKIASVAAHAGGVRVAIVLSVLSCFSAVVLAAALYGVTRDEDNELAVIALSFRVGEGVLGGMGTVALVGLLWLATAGGGASDLAGLLLELQNWSTTIGAIFFATGSTVFSYLLLRGRLIPVWLAWLGVVGSALLVVMLPLQLAGFAHGLITQVVWLPVAVFELTLGPWFLIKGVPAARQT